MNAKSLLRHPHMKLLNSKLHSARNNMNLNIENVEYCDCWSRLSVENYCSRSSWQSYCCQFTATNFFSLLFSTAALIGYENLKILWPHSTKIYTHLEELFST